MIGHRLLAVVLAIGQSDYLIAAATAAGLIVVIVISSVRRRNGAPESRQARREIDAAMRAQAAVRGDIERLMKELEDLAQCIGSQIDAKTKHLEQVIREADRRIAQSQSCAGHATITPAAQVVPPAVQAESPAAGTAIDSPSTPETDKLLARHGATYVMADQGLPPVEIARRTGQSSGEVELILNLRRAPRPTAPTGPTVKN